MERLTVWREDGRASIENKGNRMTPMQQAMRIPDVIDRLASIEGILGDTYDLDRLRELVEADREEKIIMPPVKIGERVYHITACKDFQRVLDGTMYGADGGPGTATGVYCPCELAEICPFPCDDNGNFDCDDHKNTHEIFEDKVTGISIDEYQDIVTLEYSGSVYFEEFGKTVFLSREEAEQALKKE